MDLRVIGLLLLVPLLDVMLLVAIATRIGPVPTVAIVVLTAFIGLLLTRAEGRHAMKRIRRKLAQGEPPTDELLDGGLLLIAGALMLTPGLVTDGIGLILVLPPTRYPVRVAAKRWVVGPYVDAKTGGFAGGNVYVGGFPTDGEMDSDGPFGERTPGESDHVEVGEEAYEFTDVDDTEADADDADDTDDTRQQ